MSNKFTADEAPETGLVTITVTALERVVIDAGACTGVQTPQNDATKATPDLIPSSGSVPNRQLVDVVKATLVPTETGRDESAASIRIKSEAPEHV